MRRIKLVKMLATSILLSILLGCGKEEEIKDTSFEQAKLLATEYLFVENDRYVLKLSESEAGLLGISKINYQNIVQLNDKVNQEIVELESKTNGSKIHLYDYQNKLCYTNIESPLNIIMTKGEYSQLETITSVYDYNGEASFGFEGVPNTFRLLELYAWTIDSGLYSIMVEVKCTDGFNTYDVINNWDKYGYPIYYYYNREWDYGLTGLRIAHIEYDLTPINLETGKDRYNFMGKISVSKDPAEYGGSPLYTRIVIW